MTGWIEATLAYWQSGGILLVPIAIVCWGIWGLFVRSRDVLARTRREARQVVQTLDSCDRQGGAAAVQQQLTRANGGGVAALLGLALRDIRSGARPLGALLLREAECVRLLQRDVVLLSALTAIAPLLGLLGTVMGMIATFDAVSTIAGNTSERVAAGISQALITTQFGLVVALPGMFGVAHLQRMLRSVQVLLATCRAHVLETLEGTQEDTAA